MLTDSAYSIVHAKIVGRPEITPEGLGFLVVIYSAILIALLIYSANKK